MIYIRLMNLAALDLNLLVALDALLREANVSRAAMRIGLSQPAASHALQRLREVLGDPLLVRTGARMELTPRAQALDQVRGLFVGLIGHPGQRTGIWLSASRVHHPAFIKLATFRTWLRADESMTWTYCSTQLSSASTLRTAGRSDIRLW
jgi:hypothetical protein